MVSKSKWAVLLGWILGVIIGATSMWVILRHEIRIIRTQDNLANIAPIIEPAMLLQERKIEGAIEILELKLDSLQNTLLARKATAPSHLHEDIDRMVALINSYFKDYRDVINNP